MTVHSGFEDPLRILEDQTILGAERGRRVRLAGAEGGEGQWRVGSAPCTGKWSVSLAEGWRLPNDEGHRREALETFYQSGIAFMWPFLSPQDCAEEGGWSAREIFPSPWALGCGSAKWKSKGTV